MPASATAILRTLQPGDIPAALRLSVEANWNQTADDWATLIELSPKGCMGIEIDGELVSTATLFCYGLRLAWVGMVLTKVSHRGRGFARRLLTEALTRADQMKIETVKLDATDQGQPLYEKLGFRPEQPVERWARTAQSTNQTSPALAVPNHPDDWLDDDWLAVDARAFGADRPHLLNALARRYQPLRRGSSFLLSRAGRMNQFLGPCVADNPATARYLVEHALDGQRSVGWLWDLFPKNTHALDMARQLGFTPQRHLLRMARGKELCAQEQLIFALAGFELG